jgi:hypothetical protein
MAKFYIKYVAPRRGLTMVEYLEDYLSSIGSTVTFSPAFYDAMSTFGILTGSGDDLSRVLRTIESRCSAVRLTEYEFAGASVYAVPQYTGPELWESEHEYPIGKLVVPTNPDLKFPVYRCITLGTSGTEEPDWLSITIDQETGETRLTDGAIVWTNDLSEIKYVPKEERFNWVSWMADMGITVNDGDQLTYTKYYKSSLLKEIAKKKFYDDNDSIADLSKSVMAIVIYYPDLTPEEKQIVDAQIAIMKQIYTKEVAIGGLIELTSHLSDILVGYYTAKVGVIAAMTIEEVQAITFE